MAFLLALFQGNLDDWRVYNRPLSQNEIDSLMRLSALNGLQAYWPLDEGEGIRYDSTAHNNHLQSLNNVGSAPGMLGASALFQPNQQQTLSLSHTLQSGLNLNTSSTVVGWVKPSALGNHMTLVSKHINSDPSYRLNIKDSGVLNFLLNPNPDGSGIGILAGNTVLISDTWHHVAGVFDASAQNNVALCQWGFRQQSLGQL